MNDFRMTVTQPFIYLPMSIGDIAWIDMPLSNKELILCEDPLFPYGSFLQPHCCSTRRKV